MDPQCQFFHIDTYSDVRKPQRYPNGKVMPGVPRANAAGILDEASREASACSHLDDPSMPIWHLGDRDTIERAGVAWLASDVIDARGKTRWDAAWLVAGVISIPKILNERWHEYRETAIAWLKKKYGECLHGIVEHTEEPYRHIHFYVVPKPGNAFATIHPGYYARYEERQRLKVIKVRSKALSMITGPQLDCVSEPIPAPDQDRVNHEASCYQEAMRLLQDEFHKDVAGPFGLKRDGPKRRRKNRAQVVLEKRLEKAHLLRDECKRLEKDNAEAMQQMVESRAHDVQQARLLEQQFAQEKAAFEKMQAEAQAENRSEQADLLVKQQILEAETARLKILVDAASRESQLARLETEQLLSDKAMFKEAQEDGEAVIANERNAIALQLRQLAEERRQLNLDRSRPGARAQPENSLAVTLPPTPVPPNRTFPSEGPAGAPPPANVSARVDVPPPQTRQVADSQRQIRPPATSPRRDPVTAPALSPEKRLTRVAMRLDDLNRVLSVANAPVPDRMIAEFVIGGSRLERLRTYLEWQELETILVEEMMLHPPENRAAMLNSMLRLYPSMMEKHDEERMIALFKKLVMERNAAAGIDGKAGQAGRSVSAPAAQTAYNIHIARNKSIDNLEGLQKMAYGAYLIVIDLSIQALAQGKASHSPANWDEVIQRIIRTAIGKSRQPGEVYAALINHCPPLVDTALHAALHQQIMGFPAPSIAPTQSPNRHVLQRPKP